jgi:23S rRNA (guanosine2251-2'-O)-methyltransferase
MASDNPRLVLGLQPVREAVRVHGAVLGPVLVEARENPRLDALARFARDSGVPEVVRVGRAQLDKLSSGVQHQGVAAFAPALRMLDADALFSDPALLALALDGIQDPQNFGAVLRSSVALGSAAVLWGEHGSAPLTPATFRASAGAVEHVRLCRVHSLTRALADATERGVSVVGLDPTAQQVLHSVDLRGPTIIIVGGEHAGLGRAVRRAAGTLARLGPRGPVESLNASAAAAVALYEAATQRMKSDT